ncbi:hypothetical protein [Actinomyces sp.]|nr:hypothetical protein [Actinomyces sp.]MDO4901053.1 hypothetical protein [Actinomyces sp.]
MGTTDGSEAVFPDHGIESEYSVDFAPHVFVFPPGKQRPSVGKQCL